MPVMIASALNSMMPLRTIAEAIYMPEVATTTRVKINSELKRWERLTSNPPIQQIEKLTLRNFRTELLNDGYSPDTVITTLGTINTILREACDEWDLIDHVPRIGQRRICRAIPDPNGADLKQIELIYKAADSATWPRLSVSPATFWRTWLAVVCWTGLRLSDSTLHLFWDHLHTDKRCIIMTASKTRRRGKQHVFPLPNWLLHHLDTMRGSCSTRILPVPNTMTRFRKHLTTLCTAAGVDRLTPKNLRQFAVTQWTAADETAGKLIHGCGLPRVLPHYLNTLTILESAKGRVIMPSVFMTCTF